MAPVRSQWVELWQSGRSGGGLPENNSIYDLRGSPQCRICRRDARQHVGNNGTERKVYDLNVEPPLVAHAVEPFGEAAFFHKGGRLSGELFVEQMAGEIQQGECGVGYEYR